MGACCNKPEPIPTINEVVEDKELIAARELDLPPSKPPLSEPDVPAIEVATASGEPLAVDNTVPVTDAEPVPDATPAGAAPAPAAEAETPLPVAAAQPAKADLNGSWILCATDDMTKLMEENGIGWAIRKVAKASNYGVGKAEQIIKQTGDDFEIETKAMKNTITKFTADGKEAPNKSMDGEDVLMTAAWEEDNQVMVCTTTKRDGTPGGSQRRYLDNSTGADLFVMMIVSPKGVKVRRTFKRK